MFFDIFVSKPVSIWNFFRKPKNSIDGEGKRERKLPFVLDANIELFNNVKFIHKIISKNTQKQNINIQPKKEKKTNSNEITNGHKQLNAYTVSICVNNWNGPHLKCTHDLSLELEKEKRNVWLPKKEKLLKESARGAKERKRIYSRKIKTRCDSKKKKKKTVQK